MQQADGGACRSTAKRPQLSLRRLPHAHRAGLNLSSVEDSGYFSSSEEPRVTTTEATDILRPCQPARLQHCYCRLFRGYLLRRPCKPSRAGVKLTPISTPYNCLLLRSQRVPSQNFRGCTVPLNTSGIGPILQHRSRLHKASDKLPRQPHVLL